jgi:hypothetical protein
MQVIGCFLMCSENLEFCTKWEVNYLVPWCRVLKVLPTRGPALKIVGSGTVYL